MTYIDIDQLLESTADMKIDKKDLPVHPLEIDKILESTRNWETY